MKVSLATLIIALLCLLVEDLESVPDHNSCKYAVNEWIHDVSILRTFDDVDKRG